MRLVSALIDASIVLAMAAAALAVGCQLGAWVAQ